MTDEPELDLESRQLCPDGSCVGVLGDDGRCKVCGAVGDGSVVPIASRAPVGDGDDEVSSDDAADGEEDDRKLCPDGACIGLIGSDGRCKVCGLAAS